MEKIVLFLFFTSALFALEQKGCVEAKLNLKKSILACPHATFEITFEIDRHTKKRDQFEEPVVRIIAEAKAPIKQYINRK